jgi:hypothetical protein
MNTKLKVVRRVQDGLQFAQFAFPAERRGLTLPPPTTTTPMPAFLFSGDDETLNIGLHDPDSGQQKGSFHMQM